MATVTIKMVVVVAIMMVAVRMKLILMLLQISFGCVLATWSQVPCSIATFVAVHGLLYLPLLVVFHDSHQSGQRILAEQGRSPGVDARRV